MPEYIILDGQHTCGSSSVDPETCEACLDNAHYAALDDLRAERDGEDWDLAMLGQDRYAD